MKFSTTVVVQLVVCRHLVVGFTPLMSAGTKLCASRYSPHSLTRVFSSQWDDEEDDTAKATSFEDAGVQLREEDDKKAMDAMPDYDSNPAYNSADIERFRAAIKQRADSLGIENAKLSKETFNANAENAKAAMGNGGDATSPILDLSQISSAVPRGQEDVPAMFYEPEDYMTEEEMKQADPDGQLSILDWAMKEMSATNWPTPFAALKEVVILVGAVLLTTALIVTWDAFLRDTYTNLGFIPRPEDIVQGNENLVLPDGWTDGMSEDDFMKYQDEVGKVASAAFPDL